MADKPFRCKLITPEARIFDANVSYVSVPMWDGKMGFMANSSAVVGRLGAGELRVDFVDRYEVGVKLEEAGSRSWYIAGGFIQNVNNALTILAEGAVEDEKLDVSRAQAELAQAVEARSAVTAEMDKITTQRTRARAKLAMARTRK